MLRQRGSLLLSAALLGALPAWADRSGSTNYAAGDRSVFMDKFKAYQARQLQDGPDTVTIGLGQLRGLSRSFTGSSGVLALTGTLLTTGGVLLWRRRLPRRWYGVGLGLALLLVSPYLISDLGRGITPPAGGVSVGLWLSWQLAILVSASALIVPTAALFRGSEPTVPSSWRIGVGVGIGVGGKAAAVPGAGGCAGFQSGGGAVAG